MWIPVSKLVYTCIERIVTHCRVVTHCRKTGRRSASACLRALSHGKYHLDYSPKYLDFFVRHVYSKLDKSHNASGEMRQASAERYLPFAITDHDLNSSTFIGGHSPQASCDSELKVSLLSKNQTKDSCVKRRDISA